MSIEQAVSAPWSGHARGSAAYARLLAALFCAGIATFAQLYSPQAVLPLISAELHMGAAKAALTISASTVGLAIGVIPWSVLADRIGRVKAISVSVTTATAVGLLVPFAPKFDLLLAGRLLEGLLIGGVPAIAVAYLTEEVEPAHATRAAGTFVAGTTIGGLMGRLVSSPVAEFAGWRIGVFAVAVLCGIAAFSFVRLAPQPRGFTPARRREVNPEGRLLQRLSANLRSRRQSTLYAEGFLLMGGFVAMYNFLGFRLTAAPFHLSASVVSLVFLAYFAGTWAPARAGAEATRFGRKPVLLTRILRRALHRVGLDRPVRAGGQGSSIVAVQPLLLRRLERGRLVRRRGLRRERMARGGGHDSGARRDRSGRSRGVPSGTLRPPTVRAPSTRPATPATRTLRRHRFEAEARQGI